MILDNILSQEQKICISILSGAIWIYFRRLQDYSLLPRYSLLSVSLVSIWIYLNYMEPLFLPIGLICMIIYSKLYNKNKAFAI